MIYTSSVIYKYKLVHIPWSLRKWFANTPPFTLFKNMRYLLQRLQKLLPRSLCMFMITKQSREGRGHFTPPSCDPYFSLTHRNSFSNDFFYPHPPRRIYNGYSRIIQGCFSQPTDLDAGSSRDYVKGVVGVPYVYTIELRDQGYYGFLLPPEQILPASEETWEAIRVVAKEALAL